MTDVGFDTAKAHAFFAADCFSNTWGLIDKADRTPEEDERMLELAMASVWRWTKREDVAPNNLAVGYWQVSRIHALLGRASEARRYGKLSLVRGQKGGSDPFTIGYAYEALPVPSRSPDALHSATSTSRRPRRR
ncbi:hypothetical protein KJ567_04040, partial [Candidatus Bipolaricaulota bacterium]|nr:hypothetical protein [Candidatus Bipolaricaulota bacterium]